MKTTLHRSLGLAIAAALALAGSAARAEFVLYNGALGTTPDAQGWIYATNPLVGSGATQTAAGGVTVLDTTANQNAQAGYFGNAHPLIGTLDRNLGFTVTIRLQIDRESHATNDRAGFSLIVLGSDSKGVELGFWSNEVWAQTSTPLFTHGEGAAFDTTRALADYALNIQGNNYSLSADGLTLFSGQVRDYSAFGPPYTFKNFIFFGDDTGSAAARTQIARVTLAAVPEPSSWALIGLGAAGLWYARGRKKK